MQRAAENTALSIHVKGDNTDTHLGFSRGSGSFRPKPTGLFSASSTVSSWNSASTLPWRGNMSEPQLHVLLHRPACYHTACQDWVFFSQFHLQMLRAINFSLQALATESLTLHQWKLWPGWKLTVSQTRHCIVMHSPAIWICPEPPTLSLSKTRP